MKNKGSLYIGLMLVFLGGVFGLVEIARRIEPLGLSLGWGNLWPLFIILAGLAFLLPLAIWWDRRAVLSGLSVPGILLLVNGLILLYQAVSGDWASWAYLWALEPVAVGLSLLTIYYLSDGPQALRWVAWALIGVGAVLLVLFSALFAGVWRYLLPVILIVAGLFLLLRGRSDEKTAPGRYD